jgi:hypothetical protein
MEFSQNRPEWSMRVVLVQHQVQTSSGVAMFQHVFSSGNLPTGKGFHVLTDFHGFRQSRRQAFSNPAGTASALTYEARER